MNILITGIHGFVGSNLVAALKEHHAIYGLDIAFPEKVGVFNTFVWNELSAIPSVNCIIHLAGKAHDTKNTSSVQEYFDINVGLTQKIFQYFLKSSATKFIFFSSVKAVADSVTGDQLTEDILSNPKTPYGKSKLEAEEYILEEWEKRRVEEGEKVRKGEGEMVRKGEWEKRRRGENEKVKEGESGRKREGENVRKVERENGRIGENEKIRDADEQENNDKKIYILRPCMIHGPGNKGNLNLLYKISQKGLPWPLGAFENKRSFCSIDNILFVVHQLIEKDIEPGIYQIADDEALSTNELISLMASSQNKKAMIWNIPVKLIKAIAKTGDFLHLPLDSERLKKLTESYVVSNQKIKKALGIEKMPVTAEDGFNRTFESFKKE